MAMKVRVSIFIFLLASTLYRSSHSHELSVNGERVISTGASMRSLLTSPRNVQIPMCTEMLSKLQCSKNAKCRWCKSDVLDDLCFGKFEARRLPLQVFSCV